MIVQEFFLLLLLVTCLFKSPVSALDLTIVDNDALWLKYKGTFNKSYDNNASERMRRESFAKTVEDVYLHNLMYERNQTYFKKALNKFSDVDRVLKSRQLTNIKRYENRGAADVNVLYYGLGEKIGGNLPAEYDWRNFNFNTKVRDQGDCGSCWAITVAGALEGQSYWYNRKNIELSPQELVDCSRKDHGCGGGWFESAFEYVATKPEQWLTHESRYAYTNSQQECDSAARRVNTCDVQLDTPDLYRLKCTGSKQLPYDNEDTLREALIIHGPVPVALHVTPDLYTYSSGVYADQTCVKSALNHAVLLVGYGEDRRTGLKYWTIKNSWGEDWGEGGYFKLLRGTNMCGIASYAVVPTIESYKL